MLEGISVTFAVTAGGGTLNAITHATTNARRQGTEYAHAGTQTA